MIALILGIKNAWSNWTINSLVLGVTMLLVYLLWWFMKWSPLDSLDFSRIKGRDIGRNFLYFCFYLQIILWGYSASEYRRDHYSQSGNNSGAFFLGSSAGNGVAHCRSGAFRRRNYLSSCDSPLDL